MSPIACYSGGKEAVFKAIIEAASKKTNAVEKVVGPTAAHSADTLASQFLANAAVRITTNCLVGYTATDNNYAEMQRRCKVKTQKITQCIKNNTNSSNVNNTAALEELEKFCSNAVK
jgi:hypothetical protein